MPARPGQQRVQVATAALLLLAACALPACRDAPQAPAEAPAPAKRRPGRADVVVKLDADGGARVLHGLPEPAPPPPPAPQVTGPVLPPKDALPEDPTRIQVGMAREAFLVAAGDCLERPYVLQSNTQSGRAVEVFQPRAGRCRELLGERRFWVISDKLAEVRDGLVQPPQKPDPAERANQ